MNISPLTNTLKPVVFAFGLGLAVTSLSSHAQAANPKNGAALFNSAGCVACHGPAGKGDGPAAASLNPKPRNFTDAKIMKTLGDKYLATVIAKGGAAVKKSPTMPPNPSLKPAQVADLVAHLRTLCKCQGPAGK